VKVLPVKIRVEKEHFAKNIRIQKIKPFEESKE
jgi:hypothetical protein